jgi:hypothetical protein
MIGIILSTDAVMVLLKKGFGVDQGKAFIAKKF